MLHVFLCRLPAEGGCELWDCLGPERVRRPVVQDAGLHVEEEAIEVGSRELVVRLAAERALLRLRVQRLLVQEPEELLGVVERGGVKPRRGGGRVEDQDDPLAFFERLLRGGRTSGGKAQSAKRRRARLRVAKSRQTGQADRREGVSPCQALEAAEGARENASRGEQNEVTGAADAFSHAREGGRAVLIIPDPNAGANNLGVEKPKCRGGRLVTGTRYRILAFGIAKMPPPTFSASLSRKHWSPAADCQWLRKRCQPLPATSSAGLVYAWRRLSARLDASDASGSPLFPVVSIQLYLVRHASAETAQAHSRIMRW